MLSVFLLILATVFAAGFYLLLKPANDRCTTIAGLQIFNGCFTGVASLCCLIMGLTQNNVAIPGSGLLTAALFGVVFSLTVFLNLKAVQSGPVSLTTLIVGFSLIFPIGYSVLFLNEPFGLTRILGMILLIACMFLISNPKLSGEQKFSWKWFLLTLATMLFNGTLSVIAKAFAIKTDNAYSSPFLMWGYAFATLTSIVIALSLMLTDKRASRPVENVFACRLILLLIPVVGIISFGLNYLVVVLATMMDSAVVYPVIQGCSPLLVTVGSLFFFGEKLTWKKAAAILLGVGAIVLLSI